MRQDSRADGHLHAELCLDVTSDRLFLIPARVPRSESCKMNGAYRLAEFNRNGDSALRPETPEDCPLSCSRFGAGVSRFRAHGDSMPGALLDGGD